MPVAGKKIKYLIILFIYLSIYRSINVSIIL